MQVLFNHAEPKTERPTSPRLPKFDGQYDSTTGWRLSTGMSSWCGAWPRSSQCGCGCPAHPPFPFHRCRPGVSAPRAAHAKPPELCASHWHRSPSPSRGHKAKPAAAPRWYPAPPREQAQVRSRSATNKPSQADSQADQPRTPTIDEEKAQPRLNCDGFHSSFECQLGRMKPQGQQKRSFEETANFQPTSPTAGPYIKQPICRVPLASKAGKGGRSGGGHWRAQKHIVGTIQSTSCIVLSL